MPENRSLEEHASGRFDAVLGARRGAGKLRETVRRLRPGDRIQLVLPFTEACVQLRLAGKLRVVELVGTAESPAARILDAEGRVVAGHLLPAEAGVRRDDLGFYAVLD